MNKFVKITSFSILGLALLISTPLSHAYYSSASTSNKFSTTITSNKKEFVVGESIEVSGKATPYEQGRKLSIIIRDDANNVILLKTVPVNLDGTYTYSIIDTTSWKKGNYVVSAQYGSSDVNIGTTSFSFVTTKKVEPVTSPESAKKSDDLKTKMATKKIVKTVKSTKIKSK